MEMGKVLFLYIVIRFSGERMGSNVDVHPLLHLIVYHGKEVCKAGLLRSVTVLRNLPHD